MIINKHTLIGKQGETVIYSFDVIENGNQIIIRNLNFNSPVGELIGDEDIIIDLVREEVDKHLQVEVYVDDREDDIIVKEIYITAEVEPVIIGLEGDIILTGYIPSDTNQEITINYKEVINDN